MVYAQRENIWTTIVARCIEFPFCALDVVQVQFSSQDGLATARWPGEHIAGTVEVVDEARADELTIVLEYREVTADYRIAARSVVSPGPLHAGPLTAGQTFPFSFALPGDALPNGSGRMGSTSWGLHARIARFGPDLHTWLPLSV